MSKAKPHRERERYPQAEGAPEVDPKEGDAILRRMLRTAPKQHKDMIKERRRPSEKPKRGKK